MMPALIMLEFRLFCLNTPILEATLSRYASSRVGFLAVEQRRDNDIEIKEYTKTGGLVETRSPENNINESLY